jgi:predicted phosphodiesterase
MSTRWTDSEQQTLLAKTTTLALPISSPPKILFFADTRRDFVPVIRAVEQQHPKAIILLGDMQARRPLQIELADIVDVTVIWFIHGNHDTDSDADYDNL